MNQRKIINYQCCLLGQRKQPGTRLLKVYHSNASYDMQLYEETGKLFPNEVGPEFIAKDLKSVEQLIRIMEYKVVDIRQVAGYVDATDILGSVLLPNKFDPTLN